MGGGGEVGGLSPALGSQTHTCFGGGGASRTPRFFLVGAESRRGRGAGRGAPGGPAVGGERAQRGAAHAQPAQPEGRQRPSPLPPPGSERPDLLWHLHHPLPFPVCARPSPSPVPPAGLGRGAVKGRPPPPALVLRPRRVPTALAEWRAGDAAGGRAGGGGAVSPAGSAAGRPPGRGLGPALRAPLSAAGERAPGLRVLAPGGEGPWWSPR